MHYSLLSMEVTAQVQVEENDDDDIIVGFFDEPDYRALSFLSENQRKILLKKLVGIACDAYDTEWWYIILTRAIFLQRKTASFSTMEYPKEKKYFPRTRYEYQEFLHRRGGVEFMFPDKGFLYGSPTVTDKSTLSTMCLFDLSNTLPADSKSKWMSCVTRRVSHYIIEEMGKIRDVSGGAVREKWTVLSFEEAFASYFCNNRRQPGDDSMAICWSTTTENRMFRWDTFGPRLVKMASNPLPSERHISRPVPSIQVLPGRDVFFKHLVLDGAPQFNQILVLRIILHFECQASKRDYNGFKKSTFDNNWQKVILPGNLLISIFWDNEKSMKSFVKDVLKNIDKRTKCIQAAKFNRRYWITRSDSNGFAELFHYESNDGDKCDNGFNESGNHDAFRSAHMGIITEKFLIKLIEWRRIYIRNRIAQVGHEKNDIQDLAKIGSKTYHTR